MQFLYNEFTSLTFGLLGIVLLAWLTANVITLSERRLVGAVALILAGIFFVARPATAPLLVGIGVVLWAFGLVTFVRTGLAWRQRDGSRAGPVAILVLLPAAFFGAMLLGGLLFSMLEAPARLALRLAGGG